MNAPKYIYEETLVYAFPATFQIPGQMFRIKACKIATIAILSLLPVKSIHMSPFILIDDFRDYWAAAR